MGLVKPAFLSDKKNKGLEILNQVVSPPGIIIVQAMSQDLIDAGFEAGDVLMMPAQEPVPDTLTIVPLFFFTEFLLLNPREMKGELRMVREQSFDPMSDLAEKCRDLADIPCPENPKHRCKYRQDFVFVVFVEELGTAVALRFYSAEFKTGRTLASKIKARNASPFAGRYVIQAGTHKNDKGRWYGWDFKPTDRPWVTEEEYARYEAMHDELAAAHAANTLDVTADAGDVEPSASGEKRF